VSRNAQLVVRSEEGKSELLTPHSSLLTHYSTIPLAACLLLLSCQPRAPQPPAISTAGLDPAVASLIESTLREVRAAPRSSTAWGKLGSVLMHYEFIEETRAAFEEAEALSPREPRWPHLHGLASSVRDITLSTDKFRRAASLAGERPDAPRLRLAQALAELGLNEEAEAQFQTPWRAACVTRTPRATRTSFFPRSSRPLAIRPPPQPPHARARRCQRIHRGRIRGGPRRWFIVLGERP
jgi:hypothetical protein